MFGINSIIQSGNKTVVNGIEINVPRGANISIINGEVFVNGQPYQGDELKGCKAVNIIINGDVGNIDCGGSVTANNVHGDVDCGGSCNCGNVSGSVDAGGSVNCGTVGGNVDAGGSISMSKYR